MHSNTRTVLCILDCADNNGDCTGANETCTYEKTGAERVVPRCRCKEGYTRNQEYENCRGNRINSDYYLGVTVSVSRCCGSLLDF